MMSGMGGELDSEHTGDHRREASEFPQPGGFQALLDSEFPVAMATDATSERIRAFLDKGAWQADAARKEFNQVVTNFDWNGRTSTKICNSSTRIELTLKVSTG